MIMMIERGLRGYTYIYTAICKSASIVKKKKKKKIKTPHHIAENLKEELQQFQKVLFRVSRALIEGVNSQTRDTESSKASGLTSKMYDLRSSHVLPTTVNS